MEDNTQHIDQFTKKIVKDASLERPSLDFSATLMAKLEAETATKAAPIKYEPLISWKAWLFIGCCFVGLLLLTQFGASNSISKLPPLPNFQLDLHISPLFTYGIVSLAVVFTIGIPFLRDFSERRLV